jgi:hypothetical protein
MIGCCGGGRPHYLWRFIWPIIRQPGLRSELFLGHVKGYFIFLVRGLPLSVGGESSEILY